MSLIINTINYDIIDIEKMDRFKFRAWDKSVETNGLS